MPLRIWLEYLVIIAGFAAFTAQAWSWGMPVVAVGMGAVTVGAVVMLVYDWRRWRR